MNKHLSCNECHETALQFGNTIEEAELLSCLAMPGGFGLPKSTSQIIN